MLEVVVEDITTLLLEALAARGEGHTLRRYEVEERYMVGFEDLTARRRVIVPLLEAKSTWGSGELWSRLKESVRTALGRERLFGEHPEAVLPPDWPRTFKLTVEEVPS